MWKKFIYPHYNVNASTPVLAVRTELGQYPTFVSGISRLASYMSYISQDTAPPLIRKAVYTQRVMATKSKYNWWSNSWRILNHFKVQESDPTDPPPPMCLKRRNALPISMLVATQICQPRSLPQALYFPSHQDFLWYFPVPGFWPLLPPTCPPPLPLLESPTRYRVRSTYQHPPAGQIL